MEQSRREFLKKTTISSAASLISGRTAFSNVSSDSDGSIFGLIDMSFPNHNNVYSIVQSQKKLHDLYQSFYPRPQEIISEQGAFKLKDLNFYLSQSFYTNDIWLLKEIFTGPLRVSLLKEELQSPSVLIGNMSNEIIKLEIKKMRLDIPESCLKPEGYILLIREDFILIAGADDRGTFYGVQTLGQLVASGSAEDGLPCITLYDWPDIQLRALHYLHCDDLWRANKTHVNFDEDMGREVIETMGKLKMNMLILTLGNSIKWESHPEISLPGAWSPDKFKDFLKFIKKYHIEIIPEFNLSPSHDNWLGRYHALVDTPEYFQLVQDILSEYIHNMDPFVKFIHLGMDEESTWHHKNMDLDPVIVRPPLERINSVSKFIRFLESNNVMAMIWADIILTDRPGGKWLWELYDNDSENIRLMKERVIHFDWLPYTRNGNFSVTEELLRRDFKVIIASWYKSQTETGFPLSVAQKAYSLKNSNVLGVMQTIWPAGMRTGDKPVYQAAGSYWNTKNPGLNLKEQIEYINPE